VVTDAVEEAEIEVTNDYGNPTKKSTFTLDSTQTRYEFRSDDKKTYRIDRVIIRENNNTRRTYTSGTASETNQEYTEDLEFNTITFHSDTVSDWNGHRVEVDYVPTYIHWLIRLKATLYLLENTNSVNADEQTPTGVNRIVNRIKRIEDSLTPIAVGSTNEKDYDPTIGEVIPQRRFRTY